MAGKYMMLAFALATLACCATPPPPVAHAVAAECAPQVCRGEGLCDAVVFDAWGWNGSACVRVQDSGCARVGADCASLRPTREACEADHARCR